MTHSANARLITHAAPMSSARTVSLGRADDQRPRREDQRLGAGALPDRVAAGHPRAVRDDVPAHGWPRRRARGTRPSRCRTRSRNHISSGPSPAGRSVNDRHPEARPAPRGSPPERRRDRPSGATRGRRRRRPGWNWNAPSSRNTRRAHDVDDHRHRHRHEALVGRRHLRVAAELREPDPAGQHRHQAEQDQSGGYPPRVPGHRFVSSRRPAPSLLVGDRRDIGSSSVA